jgi:hypothetical protein
MCEVRVSNTWSGGGSQAITVEQLMADGTSMPMPSGAFPSSGSLTAISLMRL